MSDSPVRLRGSTWDHPRGYASLLALADRLAPDVAVDWDIRSLRDFGEDSVADLAGRYDLIVLDHPSVGEGARDDVILPLDEWVDASLLSQLSRASVGPSWESYLVAGRPYALPIDAAGQVSASRADLIATTPQSWAEVLELATDTVSSDARVALPLVDTDVVCLVMTLLASSDAEPFEDDDRVADREKLLEVLEFLHRLSRVVHPESLEWNPIHVLDRMSRSDEILYCPALFGYVNYSRVDAPGARLSFAGVPDWQGRAARPLLGGAGIAVSAGTRHPELAARVAARLCGRESQQGDYFRLGGQPAHRDAWTDAECDELSGGFFSHTLPSMDNAYLRPRIPGFTPFQTAAGVILRMDAVIRGDIETAADRLDAEWRRVKESTS